MQAPVSNLFFFFTVQARVQASGPTPSLPNEGPGIVQ